MERTQTIFSCLTAAFLVFACGCAQPVDKKQAMVEKYNKNSIKVKLPVVENLLEQQLVDQARRTTNECLAAEPDDPAVHVMDGKVLCAEGKIDQSRQAFERAVELDANSDMAWYHLGIMEQSQGNHEMALTYFQKADAIKPQEYRYSLSIANSLAILGRNQEAIDLLLGAKQKNTRNAAVLAEMAAIIGRCGDIEGSIDLYKRALSLKPDDAKIMQPLADYYVIQKQWAAAMEIYDSLVQKSPFINEDYLNKLAMCSFNAGRYDKALGCYDQLSVLRRNDPQIWLKMAQSALGAGAAERAILCADKTLQMNPACTEAVAVIGCADYLNKRYDKAIATFAQLIMDDKLGGFAWFMTGRCYAQLGKTTLAQNAFDRAQQMNPDSCLVAMFVK